jgi:hypothetical protein
VTDAELSPTDKDYSPQPVGGPLPIAWREGTLTRAKELEALRAWVLADDHCREHPDALADAIPCHLEAARAAAKLSDLDPKRRIPRLLRRASLLERAQSNLDAAEVQLLNIAPNTYVLGQMPCLLRHVQCHLVPSDPRRYEFERLARKLGIVDPSHPNFPDDYKEPSLVEKLKLVEDERGTIVTVVRGASSASLRELIRLRDFRTVIMVTTAAMTILAIGIVVVGWLRPTAIPICFAPEEAGQAVVVCPTAQSNPFPTTAQPTETERVDIDVRVAESVNKWDLGLIELVGLAAASVSAAVTIRNLRGSSARYGLPVALAVLKLPTGAWTAFLGLLLMRGQFVPGLSALDTSAQILAWAIVFGYAQQLFTRLVDRQGQAVQESIRGASRPAPTPSPP